MQNQKGTRSMARVVCKKKTQKGDGQKKSKTVPFGKKKSAKTQKKKTRADCEKKSLRCEQDKRQKKSDQSGAVVDLCTKQSKGEEVIAIHHPRPTHLPPHHPPPPTSSFAYIHLCSTLFQSFVILVVQCIG